MARKKKKTYLDFNDAVMTSAAMEDLPIEGQAPKRHVPPPSRRPVSGPPMNADVEPRVSCHSFAMGLREEQRGGFLAYCKMQDISNVRRTADEWREMMRQHLARTIR